MFGFVFITLINLLVSGETGWTTKRERDECAQAMLDAGKTGYAESDPGAWNRHLEALSQPQPDSWK